MFNPSDVVLELLVFAALHFDRQWQHSADIGCTSASSPSVSDLRQAVKNIEFLADPART